jgi:hypothetical protein
MNNLPAHDLIYELFGSIFSPQFTHLTLQLDVFTPTALSPTSTEKIAAACQCHPVGVKT